MREPIHEKYKANKSLRTQITKEHNNQDTTKTLIKYKIVNQTQTGHHLPQIGYDTTNMLSLGLNSTRYIIPPTIDSHDKCIHIPVNLHDKWNGQNQKWNQQMTTSPT